MYVIFESRHEVEAPLPAFAISWQVQSSKYLVLKEGFSSDAGL